MCLICSEYSSLRNWASLPRNSRKRKSAAACGVNGAAVKLQAFAFHPSLQDWGSNDGLLARNSEESFSVFASLALLVFAYLGGIGSVSGALVAGVIAPGGL